MKQEARKFRIIRSTWIRVPTFLYGITLLTCFICNLAVNHTLSWFFIVLAALLCAYTFVPTVSCFFESRKLLIFAGSTYLSICLLMFTCAVYTGGLSWFLTACIGLLMGYVLVFGPIFLSKTVLTPYKFVISFGALLVLTILMELHIRIWHIFPLGRAILITCYGFTPAILCAYICTQPWDTFLKTSLCIAPSAVMFYFTNYVATLLFGPSDTTYQVDFSNWQECINGNISLIYLVSLLFINAIFCTIGIFRVKKRRKTDL